MKVKVTCVAEYNPDKEPIGVELDMIIDRKDIHTVFTRLGQVFAEKLEGKLKELKA
jgi:hypothetical protein